MYAKFVTFLTLGARFGFLVPRSTSNDLEMSMFVVETSPVGTILRCTLGISVNCTRLQIKAPFARSVVYDPVHDHVYWTFSEFINRIRSSGENYEHKWFKFDSKPSVVAIDHSSRLLFVLSSSRSSSLRSVSLQTRHQTELPAPSPRLWGLAVDALMKNIFLAEATRVIMMRYDGSARQKLLDISANYFVAMAYDPEGQRLYYNLWTMRVFGSVNIHTRNSTVYSLSNQYPSVTIYEGVLYMTDFNEREKVFKMSRKGKLISDMPCDGSKSGFARIAVFRKYGCSPGWFGRTCSLACGQCLEGSACDHEYGYCTQGCDVGWTGRTCKAESKVRSHDSGTTSTPRSQGHPWLTQG
ncbi:uncharacterized protein LOC124287692 [Haliotis rubra]|uniref:uncharacterized protein LOC124287692 n=1 Tax=Haliotis rubra TaxID=36100 RepID=UPI001EE53F38|nr:uncharacterized protein LOC124287692 [Haliotis rubra]